MWLLPGWCFGKEQEQQKNLFFSRKRKKPQKTFETWGGIPKAHESAAMKAAVLMGRRQKANCAAQRARLTTFQTLSVSCRNFYEQGRYCSEREEVRPANSETLVYFCLLFVALSTGRKHKQSNGPNPQAKWTLIGLIICLNCHNTCLNTINI